MVVTPGYMVVYISSNLRAIQDRSSTFILNCSGSHRKRPVWGGYFPFPITITLVADGTLNTYFRPTPALPGRLTNGENASELDIRNDFGHPMRKERKRL